MNLKRSWRIGALAILAALTSSLALSTSAGAAATTTTATPGATTAVAVCGQGAALVKPGSMILTCADEGELAQNLHWTSWTEAKATATGTVRWRECLTTSCARSRQYGKTSADFTLTDPAGVAGDRVVFTRLEMHVTGTTPKGFQRNLAFDEAPAGLAAPAFSRAGARPASIQATPSGSLSYAAIEGYWLYAGGPDAQQGSYDQAQIAAAITGAESSFLAGIIQPGVDYCGAGSDRAGWGLWQITCGNSVPQFGSDFQVLDPWNNAEAAVYKCEEDVRAGYNCFTPWSTWASGAYTQYLTSAAPNMSIGDPGQYTQVNSTPAGTPSSPAAAPGSTYGPPMPGSQGNAANLLRNGSFEASSAGWTALQPSSGTTNITRYQAGNGGPAVNHDGSWYLATNTSGAGGSVYQDVTANAAAGASYVATAWLSSQSGAATGRLCVFGLGSPSTSNCIDYTVDAGTYSQVQLVYDLPAAYSTLRFQLYPTPGGGTTDIDSASLVRSALRNGSFESSDAGWTALQPSSGTTNITRYQAGNGGPAVNHDGSWYLATNTSGAGGSLYQDVTANAAAGASYVATAWLSSQSGAATGRLCVFGLGSPSTSNCVDYTVDAGTYSQVQLVYDLPAAYSTLRFQLYPTPGGGTTDIDSASLVRSALRNGSFESSDAGWTALQPSSGTTNITRYQAGNGGPAVNHDGSWYLATNTSGAGGSVYQDVTANAAAGASYVATAWLSSQSGAATGRLCVFGLGSPSTSNCVDYTVDAGTYSQVQLVYDLPAAYSTLRFQLYPTPGGGTTDIDSASLG